MKARIHSLNVFNEDPNKKILISCGDIVRQFYEEYNSKIDSIEQNVAEDISTQIMAVVLTTLDKSFGFTQEQLEEFMRDMNATYSTMLEGSFWHGKLTSDTCIRYIKERYNNIDITPTVAFSKEK